MQRGGGGGDGGGDRPNPMQPTSPASVQTLPLLSIMLLQQSSSPPSRSTHLEPPEHFSHEAAQQMSVTSLRMPLAQSQEGRLGEGDGGGAMGEGGGGGDSGGDEGVGASPGL